MSKMITRVFTVGGPFAKGEHVLGNQVFKDGSMTYTGSQLEVDGLAKYLSESYQAEYKDKAVKDANDVQEDGPNASGKSDVAGGASGSKSASNDGKK